VSRVFAHGRLRLYLLKLLEEHPRHGYEVIRLLEDRFMGMYAPSAGTVYPRLQRLEAEGLVAHSQEHGRKVYRVTQAGRQELQRRRAELAELEAEIKDSVHGLAEEIRAEVRGTVHDFKQELRQAAREIRREQRYRRRERWGSSASPWAEAWPDRPGRSDGPGGPDRTDRPDGGRPVTPDASTAEAGRAGDTASSGTAEGGTGLEGRLARFGERARALARAAAPPSEAQLGECTTVLDQALERLAGILRAP